jgi:hypothetical protein
VVFILCWLPLTIFCCLALRYSQATEQLLREYQETIQNDEKAASGSG